MEVRRTIKQAEYDITSLTQQEFEMIVHGLNYIRSYVVSGREADVVSNLRKKLSTYTS